MNSRPRIHALTRCYHEAGHAIAFCHFGIELQYVTMTPPSDSGHWGQAVLADRPELVTPEQMEIEMQCAAAGEIAESWLLPGHQELTDAQLIRCFARDAATVTNYPEAPVTDGRTFAKMGIERDKEIRTIDSRAATGLETWIAIFRRAEQLIQVELWPAVQAVGEELSRSSTVLSHDEVRALMADALGHTQS
jgi:hypothetical protein